MGYIIEKQDDMPGLAEFEILDTDSENELIAVVLDENRAEWLCDLLNKHA